MKYPWHLVFLVTVCVVIQLQRTPQHACRLSFSPLGDQLAIVNSTDGDLCTFMLSERQTWRCDTHCVGHEGTVVAARYAPRVFERTTTGKGTRNGELPQGSETGASSEPGQGKSDKEGDDVAWYVGLHAWVLLHGMIGISAGWSVSMLLYVDHSHRETTALS